MSVEKFTIVGTIVSPKSLSELSINYAYVAIKNGKILGKGSISEYNDLKKNGKMSGFNEIILGEHQFLMPGLVDCHVHGPQFPNLGLGLDRPLLEWLEKYTFPLEKKYHDIEFAREVYEKVVNRLLKNGTTTACYFGTIHVDGTLELVRSILKFGQRALVGKVSMNINNQAHYFNQTDAELSDTETFVKEVMGFGSDLVAPVVTPRFAVSCDIKLMRGLSSIAAKYGCRTQSHISENQAEIEHVLKMNPDCKSYADVYNAAGILNHRCIMAHGCHLSDEELALLGGRGVSVAHCPASNTRLKSGLCHVRRLLRHNVTVGLATDVSGGDSPSILDAMRRCMDVSTHISMTGDGDAAADRGDRPDIDWAEALCLATLGGAKALSLDDKIGSLDVGKEFDALVVGIYPGDGPIDPYPHSVGDAARGLVERFVYLADDRNILQVYVQGNKVKDLGL